MDLLTFDEKLIKSALYPLTSTGIKVLQVNLGFRCNLTCGHCHLEAGPERDEFMNRTVMESTIGAALEGGIETVDITGGSPEMNPHYRWFVEALSSAGLRIKTRTNLTVLLEDGMEELPDLLGANQVEVVASLPCYTEETVDSVRGSDVFTRSIKALSMLNRAGYAVDGGGLALNLVYNPAGPFLPPSKESIEGDYRRVLMEDYGIRFSELFVLTNMPIGGFKKGLLRSGDYESYMEKLFEAYNPAAAGRVMCRDTLSVRFDGMLFDCDFNQALGLKCGFGAPHHINDFEAKKLSARRVVTGLHCYGCTAGSGSSCTGAVI